MQSPPPLTPDAFQSLAAPLTLNVRIGDGEPFVVEMRVRSVDVLPGHRYREQPFTVRLAGPPQPMLPQGTYNLGHPVIGPIALFLVPVSGNAESVEYEVVFN